MLLFAPGDGYVANSQSIVVRGNPDLIIVTQCALWKPDHTFERRGRQLNLYVVAQQRRSGRAAGRGSRDCYKYGDHAALDIDGSRSAHEAPGCLYTVAGDDGDVRSCMGWCVQHRGEAIDRQRNAHPVGGRINDRRRGLLG